MPEDMNGCYNKTLKRIIKETKNLGSRLESETRNSEGTKKAKKKLRKIDWLIKEAEYDGLLNQNECKFCLNLLSEHKIKLVKEEFFGKF